MSFVIGQRVRVTSNPLGLDGVFAGASGTVVAMYLDRADVVRVLLEPATYDELRHRPYCSAPGPGAWFSVDHVTPLVPSDNEVDE